jgi:hypothetical protein
MAMPKPEMGDTSALKTTSIENSTTIAKHIISTDKRDYNSACRDASMSSRACDVDDLKLEKASDHNKTWPTRN